MNWNSLGRMVDEAFFIIGLETKLLFKVRLSAAAIGFAPRSVDIPYLVSLGTLVLVWVSFVQSLMSLSLPTLASIFFSVA